jgi:hypothetical protein
MLRVALVNQQERPVVDCYSSGAVWHPLSQKFSCWSSPKVSQEVYFHSQAQWEVPAMFQITFLCSPLSLPILDGFGRGHFQEVQKPSHISCEQYPLGRTAVTDRVLFSVRKRHSFTILCIYSGGPPTLFTIIWCGRRGGVGPLVMHYIKVTLLPFCALLVCKA